MENIKTFQYPDLEDYKNVETRLSAQIESFSYPDGTVALSDLDIKIRRGEFVGILGSNGSGKTTLLRVLDGLHKNYQGTIFLDGSEIRKLSPKQIYGKMGLVFQNPDDQLFASTVFEDVAFGPMNMGLPEDEINGRVVKALKDMEMEDVSKKSIHNLSFGQKKRVCMAGLLAMGHEILLLDEPTAGLDPMAEHKMMQILYSLNKDKGVTIVIATHNVDLVPTFLDKLFILSKGTVIRSGAPEVIFNAPQDLANVKLRLPQIAELIYKLKHEDKMHFDRIPLTISEARREIIKSMGVLA